MHVDATSAWYAPKVFQDRLQIHYVTLLRLDVRCHRLMRTGNTGESELGALSWLPLQDEDCDGHSGDGDGETCHVFALSCGVWSGSTQVCSERLHGQDRRPQQACEWNHWGQKGQEQEEVRAPEGEEYRRALLFLESGWECEYVSMLLWKHHCWGEALNLIPCYSHSDCTDSSRAKTTASELGDIIGQYEYALQDWAYIRFFV